MSEPPSERLPRDPVRVVYHAGNRTFARLFNERSLDEVKDVVRRKLGLEHETIVSLKQMGSDVLVDLEDDDDFQAFRVLLKSCVSVDIQVTLSNSPRVTVSSPVPPKPRGRPSVGGPATTTSSGSPSRQPARSATPTRPSARPEAAHTTGVATVVPKTPGPSSRKRKVSFDPEALAVANHLKEEIARRTAQDRPAATETTRPLPIGPPTKPAERRTTNKVAAVGSVASAETVGSPTSLEPVGTEEPPKKRQKKETTKTKKVHSEEAVQSSPAKTSDTSKSKPTALVVSNRESEAETSVLVDAVASQPLAKKTQKRKKKDDGPGAKKSLARAEELPEQSIGAINETPLQSEKPQEANVETVTSTTRKSGRTRTITDIACAAIPQTDASTTVLSEVTAAILSGIIPTAQPPAKRKYVRKATQKTSAPANPLPAESVSVSCAPSFERSDVPAQNGPEHVVPTTVPPEQTPESNNPPCPICLGLPFHIRYCCPTVLKGSDAIRERLEELRRSGTGDQSLIKELEGLLHDSTVTSRLTLDAAPHAGAQLPHISPPSAPWPRAPIILNNSQVSEVTVESRDEGSSSESSEDVSEEENDQLLVSQRKQTLNEQPPLPIDDLEIIIRGPAHKSQSVLNVIDRIVGDDSEEDYESADEDEDEAVLDEDLDEEIERSRRQFSKRNGRSADSESEAEESRSLSGSGSVEGTSKYLQVSNKPAEESVGHRDNDVIMGDVDPPAPERQDEGSSEETHVESEDRMDVDPQLVGGKGTVTAREHQPIDALSNEPRKPWEADSSNQDGSVPIAFNDINGAEVDPIEPADDFGPSISRSSDADPIEIPSEDVAPLLTGLIQSTPKPGVTERIKTRSGKVLEDVAERPVPLGQLFSKTTDVVTPLPTRGRPRRKISETPASQEPVPTRKSPRFSSVPPSTSTPVAVALLNHRAKVGTKSGKATKTPAKRSKEQPDVSQSSAKGDITLGESGLTCTPSLVEWETLGEPSSPSVQPEEPSVRIDELMSSSPQPGDVPMRGRLNGKAKRGRPRKVASSSQAENSQGKERLFDLTSSQIPFPYSQQITPAPSASLIDGKNKEERADSDSDSDSDREQKVPKTKGPPVRYRSLSQLTSQAIFYSPSLPTPANKSATNGKTKKRALNEESSSSSSSSSDAVEVNGSEHIPRGRRAGAVLETKKRKGLLSKA